LFYGVFDWIEFVTSTSPISSLFAAHYPSDICDLQAPISFHQLLFFRTVFLKLASVVFLYVVVYLQIFCQRYDLSVNYIAECQHCEGMRVIGTLF